jgi:hypothetical protein
VGVGIALNHGGEKVLDLQTGEMLPQAAIGTVPEHQLADWFALGVEAIGITEDARITLPRADGDKHRGPCSDR